MVSSLLLNVSLTSIPTRDKILAKQFHPIVASKQKGIRFSKSIEHVNDGQYSRSSSGFKHIVLNRSLIPLAASLAILLSSIPANAGILSGFSGIESVPGPQLPEIDFLARFNEENQKRYAENDARFKESPILKKLLERTKQNKEKNKQEIQDKYCLRGAEWGVGDCSTSGMSPDERDKFIAMLKQKAGVE